MNHSDKKESVAQSACLDVTTNKILTKESSMVYDKAYVFLQDRKPDGHLASRIYFDILS